jgi:predicted glycosyltransferase involved in capsule biosynthesis
MKNIILVPYRDREIDMKYFLENSFPLLKKNIENLKIVIVEQENGKSFNRGITINIGFQEMEKESNGVVNNYFTHDIDVNPFEHTIKEIYNKPIDDGLVMGIYTSQCNTLGGIIKFNSNTFKKINGFANNFWGWGCEDKDLQNRVELYNIKIIKNILKNTEKAKKYFKVFDNYERDRRFYNKYNSFVYNKWKSIKKNEKEKYVIENGLSTLKYEVVEKTINEDIIKIKVKV